MKAFALYGSDANEAWSSAGGGNGSEPDYCSRDGAVALKDKIESYWRERGQDVMLSLHNVGFHPAIRAARYDVRSDMINGFPRASLTAPAANDKDSFSVSLVDTDAELEVDDVWLD
ncbi:MAG: hypothetical protein WDM79_15070 [Terricaulis sp.]